MKDFIERVRAAADVVQLAEGLTNLKPAGANRFAGNCPFHQEKDASFVVYADQGSWHCFGCKRGGSAFDFVMEEKGCDFADALIHLAAAYNIPAPNITPEQRKHQAEESELFDFLEAFVQKAEEKLAKSPAILDYLHEQGFTDDSIRHYRIGVGPKIREGNAQAEAVGLTRGNWQPMAGRIVFPIFRTGKVVQLSGRKPPGDTSDTPKYYSLPGRDLYPFNAQRLRNDKVVLVEGVKDAILLEQAGFPACATISASIKPEWAELVGRETRTFCCYDADENGAGQAANEKVAGILADKGRKVSIVELPTPNDPAEFVQAEGAGGFQALMDEASPFVEWLIGRLDEGADDSALKPVFSRMVGMTATARERHIKLLAERTKIPKVALRADVEKLSKNGHARESKESESGRAQVSWRTTDPIKFNPAQDVIGGVLYYTVYLQTEAGTFVPFVISSNRECFPLTKDDLMERDYVLRTALTPSDTGRWSIGTDVPFNVKDYLDGKAEVEPVELYRQIKGYFERYLRFPDPFYYDFLPLWVMNTYCFRAHDTTGYIFLYAIKGAGKSQTMMLVNHLAFNSKQADAITEASLKRSVAGDSSTLLYDEAEKLWRRFEKDESSFQEVIKGGYTRAGSALSVNKETHLLEEFPTYSPKVFANTRGMDDTIGDRCITLYLERDTGKIPQFLESQQAGRLKVLRNQLYCFGLQRISDILDVKESLVMPEDGLSGRDWQLWEGVFVMARLLDSLGAVVPEQYELNDGRTVTLDGLFDRMMTMAVERREYKIQQDEEADSDLRVLMALWRHCCEEASLDDWYQGSELCKAVTEDTGWEKFSTEALSKMIFDKLHIAANRKTDKRKSQVPGMKQRRWFYRLDRQVMMRVAKKVFGVCLIDPYAPDDVEEKTDVLG